MSKLLNVDPHDFIDQEGNLPVVGAARLTAVRVAQCIEYAGTLAKEEGRATLIPCRFRPGGVACDGFLIVIKQPDTSILAVCNGCEEPQYLIHNWQDMPWAKGPAEAVHLDQIDDEDETSDLASLPPGTEALDERLTKALKTMGWQLSASELRQMISKSHMPSDVFRELQMHFPPPPNAKAVKRFLPLLMEAWNHTPRPELAGRSPNQVAKHRPARAEAEPSRNSPCPCGSGRKYKRCCISKRFTN